MSGPGGRPFLVDLSGPRPTWGTFGIWLACEDGGPPNCDQRNMKERKWKETGRTINLETAHERAMLSSNWLTRPPRRGHDACCVGYGFGRDNNMTIHTRHTSRHVH